MVVLEATPLSIGVALSGGLFCPIIDRKMQIPGKQTKVFYNSKNDQDAMLFKFYEGVRGLAEHNTYLGQLRFQFPKKVAKANTFKVTLCLSIDSNGMLVASAQHEKETPVKWEIDYTGVKKQEDLAEKELQVAEELKEVDEEECARRKAKINLVQALEEIKYVTKYPRKFIYSREQIQQKKWACARCDAWLSENASASRQQFIAKLCEFQDWSDYFDDEIAQGRHRMFAGKRKAKKGKGGTKTKRPFLESSYCDGNTSSSESSENDLIGSSSDEYDRDFD